VVTKKLQIQGINHYSKFYHKSGVAIAEEEDTGEIYLTMKLDEIDKIFIFFLILIIFSEVDHNAIHLSFRFLDFIHY
jgi:hypothetical protein